MVRLAELPDVEREHLLGKACDPFDSRPWTDGPPLSERRVALVTTAGLHRTRTAWQQRTQPRVQKREETAAAVAGKVSAVCAVR